MRIPSFQIDHTRLKRGIYVSRKDYTQNGDIITTFDLRLKEPNVDFMLPESAHTIEHIGATYLRNSYDNIIYFGPMGCMTGFYLILNGDYESEDIVTMIKDLFYTIRRWDKKVPGTSERECGNYKYHNLNGAKRIAEEYLRVLDEITEGNLIYPK